ncbi:hypothetical protein CXZ10_11915 [Pleomorphomonas diazotrophica]|uniref:DUF1127 domain-containing protein n=1 Tax=Pleomorphomonas diazotrophica TaxID=1166257 RepID=A0A1I4SB19_9HYPH|nr:hypothetical protein [Pleomorphomonas diazotrophica]PKR88820.1 hypothetical protein CXZ10_11915 [Pleomorphomonas diazotrophica]SFM61672.1 hypothetical protein SAMN05192571_103198 [Pleomorphomonas diazotrophica]
MTCVDHTVVRRGLGRAVFLSAPAVLAGAFAALARWRGANIEDLNEHMLRDIGVMDGRATEAGMRRAADRRYELDRF